MVQITCVAQKKSKLDTELVDPPSPRLRRDSVPGVSKRLVTRTRTLRQAQCPVSSKDFMTSYPKETGIKTECSGSVSIRMPQVSDGKRLHALTQETGILDVNSEYLYLLLGAHFQQTCAVVEKEGQVSGFVSAYIPPAQPDVLFIWQVAIDRACRKQGLALAMVKNILQRHSCAHVTYLQATIAPANHPSRAFFKSLARVFSCPFHEKPFFRKDDFAQSHEAEPLCCVGPLARKTFQAQHTHLKE